MDAGGESPGFSGGAAGNAAHRAARGRRTATWVRVQDRAASVLISFGGLIVLLAMLGICVFLVVSAAPLFAPGVNLGETARFSMGDRAPLWMSVDSAFGRVLSLDADGMIRVRDLSTGDPLTERPALEDGGVPSAVRAEPGEGWLTLSLENGGFVIARPEFSWEPFGDAAEPGELASSDAPPGTFVQSFEDGGLRRWSMSISRLGPFADAETGGTFDTRGQTERSRAFAGISGSEIRTGDLGGRRALGGAVRYRARSDAFSVTAEQIGTLPDRVYASGDGHWAFLMWESGRIAAIDREAESDAVRVLELDPSAGDVAPITASAMALGAQTLLTGDEAGVVSAWSIVGTPPRLVRRMERKIGDASVSTIRPGDRDRTIVVGLEDGSAVMFNQGSRKRIVSVAPDGFDAIAAAAASPGSDAFMVVDSRGEASVTAVEPGHVEASFGALFGKMPYEGYDEAAFVYQSTGDASAEPKYSLVPLIWGTMKATIVAMLIAAPLAVLAAIYSGEFLSPRVRKYVKPSIELMASLPSVVLGFMAAMVVAPFVRDQLPRVLVLAATGPIVVVLAAHAWRMIPRNTRVRWGAAGQFGAILVATIGGVLLAIPAGGWIESGLFPTGEGGGSIRGWLEREHGGPAPGWTLAMLPIVVGVVLLIDGTLLNQIWRRVASQAGDRHESLGPNAVESVRLLINLAVSVLGAVAIATALSGMGFDPRDSIFGPFSQRNTLVVGLIMGIAVIPIIYTISEDAIRSVPVSLRSASLGVGATPWQTAVRVVLPVAASGIFSAVMVGLGRAVGETMIVLMATGNTPEMTMNIFSGFRTLAANIAVELPEAPRASTHYRVLFLCGLVLFLMTLVINTSAELVRQHFRKKNAAL